MAAPVASPAPASFVDQVWKVSESAQVIPGSLYVFLSDGTLLITSAHGAPALGKWREEDGGLVMLEQGIPARLEVLKLSRHVFRIRSRDPGEAVEMTLVPARG